MSPNNTKTLKEEIIDNNIYEILKNYNWNKPLSDELKEEFSLIYSGTSGCSLKFYMNNRIYTYLMKECILGNQDVDYDLPDFIDWQELTSYSMESDNEDETIYDYIIKTYDNNRVFIDLFEYHNNKFWTNVNINEAIEAFAVAIQKDDLGVVEFIKININGNDETRETIIDKWEKDE